MSLKLMILVDTPLEAIQAQEAGIDRIFFDLEYIGKAERQAGINSVKSHNVITMIPQIREVVTSSDLLVRTNPIHAYIKDEVEKCIHYGADILILPMAMNHHDVEEYVRYVDGRAKVCIMIETAAALARLDDILAVPGVDEIFIGLNDMHLSMGLTFMFELLSGGLVEYAANKCKSVKIPFGFGGIARIGEGLLPADYVLGEHIRLGSSSVILSRTFKGVEGVDANARIINLSEEVGKIRKKEQEIKHWREQEHQENIIRIKESVQKLVEKLR